MCRVACTLVDSSSHLASAVDAEEQQRQAEEALRKRYEEDYEKAKLLKQQKQGQQPLQQQQPKNSSVELPVNVDNLSILDEYDPYRAR